MSPVVVIGAGFAGLSAACHLRQDGHEVTVVEAADGPGGWARNVHHGGYRFDGGPTVITMVDLLRQAFKAVDADLTDHVKLERLDPFYTANFADGSRLRIRASIDATAEEFAREVGPAAAGELRRFVAWLDQLYRLEFDTFIAADVASVPSMLGDWRQLMGLARIGGFERWQNKARQFFTDERLQRLFSFQAMYAGLSPVNALALFAVIAHMDSVQGVYAPVGGVGAVAEGLASAADSAGVGFRYGARVDHVVPGPGGQTVVLADGERLDASAVVMTADRAVAERELLGLTSSRPGPALVPSPSCVVWHLAAPGSLPEHTTHHNIHFGHAWDAAFADLFEHKRPMADPSRFVTVGSVTDPTAAPEGGNAVYVLEPTPNLSADLDWSRTTPRLTEAMLAWADRAGYPVADAEVVGVIDPPEWRRRGAMAGTPFSVAHHFKQSGPFRPGPEDPRAPGVIYAGAGTRPGVGIPMVVLSGRIAAARVKARWGAQR